MLELDDLLADWSRDTLQSDYLDRGRAALRSMVVRLGDAAAEGLRDPRQVVAPFVEAMLDARRDARAGKRFADADALARQAGRGRRRGARHASRHRVGPPVECQRLPVEWQRPAPIV